MNDKSGSFLQLKMLCYYLFSQFICVIYSIYLSCLNTLLVIAKVNFVT